MTEQERRDKRRLLDDRVKLYDRLMRVGYIPDKDMRRQIEAIRHDLNTKIILLSDELMAAGE